MNDWNVAVLDIRGALEHPWSIVASRRKHPNLDEVLVCCLFETRRGASQCWHNQVGLLHGMGHTALAPSSFDPRADQKGESDGHFLFVLSTTIDYPWILPFLKLF